MLLHRAPIPHIAPAPSIVQYTCSPNTSRISTADRTAIETCITICSPNIAQCSCTEHPYLTSHLHQASCNTPAARTHRAFQLQIAPRLKRASQSAVRTSRNAPAPNIAQCSCTEHRAMRRAHRTHTAQYTCAEREKADREMRSAFGFYITAVLHVRPCGRALRSAHLTPSLFSARRKRRSYTYTTVSGARRSLSSRGA